MLKSNLLNQVHAPLILLVDDEPLMRIQLKLYLQKEGYRLAEAENGREGLDIFKRICPDIVLLDAMMPDMNGFDCCAELQRLPCGSRTPVLIITGLDDQESVDRAFSAGAADFVTKPVHWAVLRQRVKRLIQQSQLQQQLEAANRELQRLASVDGLTEVANRRRFDEYLAQVWQHLIKEQVPLSLILCDIDCFKAYNDTYGHQAGDRCLRQVAQAIDMTIKYSTSLVARYGGEEFAIILPSIDIQGATQVAELIRSAIKTLSIPHTSSARGYITLSLGVSSIAPHSAANPAGLIAVADTALYQAKERGRDCAVAELALLTL